MRYDDIITSLGGAPINHRPLQVDEFIMLADPHLSLFTEEGGCEEDINELPQHKITHFTYVMRYIATPLSCM